MKTKLFLLLAMALSLGANAQVSNTYAFAEGTTDGVTIRWDAYSDEVEIIGCLVYKRLHFEDEPFLLTEVIVVSDDSTYTFVDDGEFDFYIPPKYFIKAVTTTDTIEFSTCWPFASIDIDALDTTTVQLEVTVWNTDTCCMGVRIFYNDIFYANTQYSNPFQPTIDLDIMSLGDEISFMFEYFWGEYQRITLSYEHLIKLTETTSVNEFHKAVFLHQNSPNPFNTETFIRFELLEKSYVSLDVYSSDGRLLKTLVNKTLSPGLHVVTFQSNGLSQGVYFYRLRTDAGVSVRKMIVN